MRVAISNAYWPFIWPSPETANLTLLDGSISIPIRVSDVEENNEWAFDEPLGSPPWDHSVLRPSSYSRRLEIDEKTGETVHLIDCDSGENIDNAHGLVSGSWTRERWTISPDDPTSAVSEISWEQTGGREEQIWRTEVHAKMWCDKDTFYSTATLKCWLNGDHFFERDYRESITRNLV